MWAAAEGQARIVQLLLDAGADRDHIDVDGDTACSFATKNHHVEVARLLQQ
jgi:ankyrin repeat protein